MKASDSKHSAKQTHGSFYPRFQQFKKTLLINSPGMRIIKTGIALLLSLLVTRLYASPDDIQAPIAAIVCLGQSMQHTKEMSFNRIFGTVYAGLLAILFMFFSLSVLKLSSSSFLYYLLVALFTAMLMWSLILIKKPGAVVISSIVFVIITSMMMNENYLMRAMTRVMNTIVGVLIAILVNWFPLLNRLGKKMQIVQIQCAEAVHEDEKRRIEPFDRMLASAFEANANEQMTKMDEPMAKQAKLTPDQVGEQSCTQQEHKVD